MEDSAVRVRVALRAPAHPLLRTIRVMAERCRTMRNSSDFEHDPAWLRLPVRKRLRALNRYRAVGEYLEGKPTMERAKAAAKSAGVSLRTFYGDVALLQRSDANILDLVPHLRDRSGTPQMLDDATAETLRTAILHAIDAGMRGSRAITNKVAEDWPPDGPLMPSLRTVRLHVDSRGGFESIERGTISLNTGSHAQETAETATAYGEVLVLDHSALELFLDHSAEPRRASITFAIDLLSASIAGFVLGEGAPGPDRIGLVLHDVEGRTRENEGEPIRPRLLLAATNGEHWRSMVADLARRGLKAKVRWGTSLHFGGPTRRMIGPKFGEIGLHARKMHGRSRANDRFDPDRHALLTLDEAQIVVEDAVRALNSERLLDIVPARIVTRP